MRWRFVIVFAFSLLMVIPPILAQDNPLPNAQFPAGDSRLLVHGLPYTDSPEVGYLEPGAPIVITGRSADGLWVQTAAHNGREGWVITELLNVTVDLSTLPVTHQRNTLGMSAALAPEVVDHIRHIYRDGLVRGNDPHVFAKVGDSMTAGEAFFAPVGEGNYKLGAFAYLEPVIQYYTAGQTRTGNPFTNESLAAAIGWSASTALNPRFADPGLCREGEMPLLCEYRLNRPSVALIMFGTNDLGQIDRSSFYGHLERIVTLTIDQGIIPVISTIPLRVDYEEKTDSFNEAIISIATKYAIPLWDYGAALANLDDNGLGTDGVHPTLSPTGIKGTANFTMAYLNYGYNRRNLTGLLMLDAVWRALRAAESTPCFEA